MGFTRNRMLVRALIHIIVVLTMSGAGVVLRANFAYTNTQLLLDISSIMAENSLLLSIGSSLVHRTKSATVWCYRLLLALALLLLCASVFMFASADYLYQSLTGGVRTIKKTFHLIVLPIGLLVYILKDLYCFACMVPPRALE